MEQSRAIDRMEDYPAAFDIQGRPTQRRVRITCPYCQTGVVAYVWSLCGSGKRCPCGVLLTYGTAFKGQRGIK